MANNNKTPFLGLTTPASGDYNWGAEINNNFIKLDRVYGGLQSDMEGLETTQRQDGFFNFIEGQEYILLSSILVSTDVENRYPLFDNNGKSDDSYKGSQFFIAGTVKQSEDMTELEFIPSACYCTAINKKFPSFNNKAAELMKIANDYVKIPIVFSPTGDYHKNDIRLEQYTIKIVASSIEVLLTNLANLPRIPTYQMANNTAFYVTVPARGYTGEKNSTLYKDGKIYYERQLVVKYTDVGAVIFASLNNTTGGVYVPQKELNSNSIHFIRRPITDTAQNVNAYVEPWYVYGESFDISGYSASKEEGKWTAVVDEDKHYYTELLKRKELDTSNKNLYGIQIDFFDLGSPTVDGYYKKVIVEYNVKNMNTDNVSSPELHVYGLSREQIRQLLARTTYIRKALFDENTTELWDEMKKYVDEQIKLHVTGVINSDV